MRCTVADPDPAGQRFRLPTWIPGSYLIREFARHFVSVRAEANGAAVTIAKEAKDLWRAAPCTGPLTVVADVYAFDFSVRTAYLDALRGYFNGPSVFLCPEGRADAPCEVEIVAPEGAAFRNWRVATTLPRAGAAPWAFGTYRAANYDELIDHPVEMADFLSASFEAGGATHDIAITGKVHVDLDRLTTDLARICQWHVDLFGGAPGCRAPFDRYLFQIAAVGDGYGGLEHRTSTSLCCKRDELPAPGVAGITADYRRFLGLASHEYFHSWNVKRIKPAPSCPTTSRAKTTRASYGRSKASPPITTTSRWCAAASSILELSGARRAEHHERVARARAARPEPRRFELRCVDQVLPAATKTPRTRSSATTPKARSSRSRSISRCATRGTSLDDLMRALWQRHGETGIGVPEDGVESLAIELAGANLSDFFARFVRRNRRSAAGGTAERIRRDAAPSTRPRAMPIAAASPARNATDDEPPAGWLGASLTGGAQATLQHVFRGGRRNAQVSPPATSSSRSKGCGCPSTRSKSCSAAGAAGETLAVHAFRRDELIAPP